MGGDARAHDLGVAAGASRRGASPSASSSRVALTAPSRRRSCRVRAPESGSTRARRQVAAKPSPRGDRLEHRPFGAGEVEARDRLELHARVLEPGQELEQLVAPAQPLGDQLPGRQREAHHVVGPHLALPEEHLPGAIGEERPHDLLDLRLHAGPQLARREEAALDQHPAELRARRVGLLRLAELLGRDHADPQQHLAQAVDLLVGGREDDLAAMDVDRLRVVACSKNRKPDLRGGVQQVQHVGEREGPHVRAQHEVAVPGQRRGRRSAGALEQDGARAGRQHAQRLVRVDPEPAALLRAELQLGPRPRRDVPSHPITPRAAAVLIGRRSPRSFRPPPRSLEAPGAPAGGAAWRRARAALHSSLGRPVADELRRPGGTT